MIPIVWIIKLTIQRSLRSKLSLAVVGLLFLFLVGLPLFLLDDGTLKGKMQIHLMWSMGGILLLLSLFSLLCTLESMCSDIVDKQIYFLEATPILRWQLVLGKLLGVFLLNLVLVILSGLICYFFTYLDFSKAKAAGMKAEAILDRNEKDSAALLTLRDYHIVKNEVFASRLKLEDYYNVEEMAERALTILKSKGSLPEKEEDLRKKYRQFYMQQRPFYIAPGQKSRRPILFQSPPDLSTKTLFVTFSYYLYNSDQFEGRIIGYWDVFAEGEGGKQELISTHRVNQVPGIRHSIRVSTEKIKDVKFLYFLFTNLSDRNTYDSPNEAFYLLIPYSSFELNFVKALFLILMKLTLISIVAACAASYLSFNVSLFVCFAFLLFSYLSDFIFKFLSLSRKYSGEPTDQAANFFISLWNQFAGYFAEIFPNFNNISGRALVNGEYIQNTVLLQEVVFNIFLRGGFFFLLAIVIFHFVELGKGRTDD